jgi:lysophospholipase L1-like esterase
MPLLFQPNQKLLFIGDSITDAGRTAGYAPYGHGYVYLSYLWLAAAYPELDLTIVNKGISGHTSRDLVARWERDVISEQPDWLSVKIGANDVWRALQSRWDEAVSLAEFERNYREMLDRTRSGTQADLILAEPFLVEGNPDDSFRRAMDEYRHVVRQLAQEYDTLLVKTQDAFDRGLDHRPAHHWAEDRVHPTEVGHALIAHEFLRVCGSRA